jgi:WD40 repeat protein
MHLPGKYAWNWLIWHLAQAGRKSDIEKLLYDPVWLQEKIKATSVNALIAGFDYLKPSPEAALIQGALRLSAHVLAKDLSQFPSQIIGRLLPHCNQPAIRQFSEAVSAAATTPWLKPRHPALHPPGTPLLRTLSGHTSWIYDVALSADGHRAISASADGTLKVWDLDTGQELRTLVGHSNALYDVALSADGRRAVSASDRQTLKVWDLDTGQELRTLAGHSSSVHSVALTADGRRAVSASADSTLKVWDLDTGQELRTLAGHSDWVNSVALSVDERHAVSSSDDNTLRAWDLETGACIATFTCDSSTGCCAFANSRAIVAGDNGGRIHFLSLEFPILR